MSQPAPNAKPAAKAVASPRHAVLASHPALQLIAGVIAGAVAWATITLPSFPRFLTDLELAGKQAAEEGASPDAAPQAAPERGGGRVRGEGRGGDRGDGGGGEEDGRDAAEGAQNPPGSEPAADETATPAAAESAPAEVSAGEAPDAPRVEANAAPSDPAGSGCQPPQDTDETAQPDDAVDSAPAVADPPLPTREDVPGNIEPAAVDPAAEGEPVADNEGDAEADPAQAAMSPEDAREEEQIRLMMERMRNMGGMPAMGGMGGGMSMGAPPLTPEQVAEARSVGVKNAALAIGFFGMLLCGLIGLIEGIWRRTLAAPVLGLLVGLFLGAIGGGLAGIAGKSIYYVDFADLARDYLAQHPKVAEVRPILDGMLMYGAMWTILGVAAGLSMSLLSRRPRVVCRSVFGAAIGGLLGGLLYATIEAVAFPLEADGLVIPRGDQQGVLWRLALPTGLNGWLWATIPAGMIALLGCWQGRVPPKAKSGLKIRNPAPAA